MDRTIVYPSAIPQDTDILNSNLDAMIAVGYLAQATLGTGTLFDGLACTQTTSPSAQVSVAPGSVVSNQTIDATAYGSLALNANNLVKIGVNTTPTLFTIAFPGTSGQSQNYLIEGSFLEQDVDPVVLPYYNSSNPAMPYSGPSNSGTPQNTLRQQTVALQLKAGTPATTGTQTTPSVDANWTGLYVITVANGATTVINSNISTYADGGQFIGSKKTPNIPLGEMQAFTTTGTFVVPSNVTRVKVYCTGGGGGGAGCASVQDGGGGAAGGTAIGYYAVTASASITVTIGAAGTGGAAGYNAGGNGGNSSFGSLCSAGGGTCGANQNGVTTAGGQGGVGVSGQLNLSGGNGAAGGIPAAPFTGNGGASYWGGGGEATTAVNALGTGQAYGSGGGGAVYTSTNIAGNAGKAGVVVVEY
jgi:hypothetical protein